MRKLALFGFSLAAAICAANYGLSSDMLPWMGAGCALLGAVAFVMWRRTAGQERYADVRAMNRYRVTLISWGMAAGLLWMWGYGMIFYSPAQKLIGTTGTVTATVLDYSEATDYGIRVLIQIHIEQADIKTLFYGDSGDIALVPGDELTVTASFVSSEESHGEEVSWYKAKGIFLIAYQAGEWSVASPERKPVWTLPAEFFHMLKNSIDHLFSGENAALVRAVVTGNRDRLTDAYSASLSRTGLSHTVAVSGMHISFLVGVLTLLLGRHRRRTALICMPLLLFFMLAAGSTPSVVRASLMQMLLLIAPLFKREYDTPTSLSFVLMLLLLQNPFSAAQIGLQLSFASVAGICLFSDRMYEAMTKWLKPAKRLPHRMINGALQVMLSSLSASLGAMVFTTPLAALYFDTVSLVAPLANLLTLWAVSLLFLGGLFSSVLGLLWMPLGIVFAAPASLVAWYLNWMVPVLGRMSFAAVTMSSFYYRAWLAFVYGVLLIWLLGGRKRAVIPLCAGAVTLCVSMLFTKLSFTASALTVSVLDVGQGESVALLSGGNTALVDCGGNGLDNAGDIAADYLQNLGTGTLNVLALTHFHSDHANGVAELFDRLRVENVFLPQTEDDSELKQEILALCEEEGAQVWYVSENFSVTFGEANLTFYAPLGAGETNEEGLTVLCTAGDYDILMTGDMGSDVEKRLVKYCGLPDIELYVAGHHGSRYSSSELLLDAVKPETAVISVGYNTYGHPSEETLERMEERGIEVYRTDLMGTVTIQVG